MEGMQAETYFGSSRFWMEMLIFDMPCSMVGELGIPRRLPGLWEWFVVRSLGG